MVGGVGTVAAQSAPDGFVGVPDTNVVEDLPVGENRSLTEDDLEGSVMASDHASSLQVVVTTPERAEEYVNGSRVGSSGDTALVFQDETNHEGREVAVPADAVREAVGHTPEVVHGVHEDGETWTSQVDARNGLLVFEIPKFSANSVTFEGEVSIDATAQDGSSFVADVGSPSEVSDYQIDVTGKTVEEWDNVTGAGLGDGDELDVHPDGNLDPTGPDGDPEIILTGDGFENAKTEEGSATDGDSTGLDVEGNLDPAGQDGDGDPEISVTGRTSQADTPYQSNDEGIQDWLWTDKPSTKQGGEVMVKDPPKTITGTTFQLVDSNNWEMGVDVYIAEETPDGDIAEGEKVADNATFNSGQGNKTIDLDSYSPSSDADEVTLGFKVVHIDPSQSSFARSVLKSTDGAGEAWAYSKNEDEYTSRYPAIWLEDGTSSDVSVEIDDGDSASFGSPGDGETVTRDLDLSTDTESLDWSASGGSFDYEISRTDRAASENPALDLDGDGTDEVSHNGILEDGETVSEPVGLSTDDDSATVSTAGSSTVDAEIQLQERVKTRDPAIEINGHWTNHTGALAEGETAELETNTSWIQDGENRINVSVGDGTLSDDAPTPAVNLDYSHSAQVQESTEYVANGWEESYEVNHTFAGDREDATVTIPFSRTVHDIRHVETSVNGGEWTELESDDYELENGTTLTVHPEDTDGDPGFEAGDELAVRTAGYKVQVKNGEIEITDPTEPSDPTLDAGFRVDDIEQGFHLEVGDTYRGDRVHYTYDESWDADEETVLDSDGSQDIYLPDAVPGGTARVTTIPMEVGLDSGDVGIHVVDPDDPELEIGPGRDDVGADVTYRWYSASGGTTYGLYSLSRTRYVDKQETGDSYVALVDDDSEETLVIQKPGGEDAGGGDGDGSSADGGGGSWQTSGPDTTLQEFGVVAGWAALVVVLIGATGRSALSGRRRWIIVASIGGATGLFSLEVLRPGVVSNAIGAGLEEIIPLAGLAGIGIVGYTVVSWWQARKEKASTPETQVDFEVGGSSD